MPKQKTLTFSDRVQSLRKDYVELHKKYNLASQQVIVFPAKKKAPLLAKWAGKVILKLGGQLDVKYYDLSDLKETQNGK